MRTIKEGEMHVSFLSIRLLCNGILVELVIFLRAKKNLFVLSFDVVKKKSEISQI